MLAGASYPHGPLAAFARDAFRVGAIALVITLLVTVTVDRAILGDGSWGDSTTGGTTVLAVAKAPQGGDCPEGWVLPQIEPAKRRRVEKVAGAWYRELETILRRAYNDASEMKTLSGPVKEPEGHKRFDVIMPAVDACPRLARVGGEGDGGKLICGLEQIPDSSDNPCIVYSIGGNNQWGFEADVVAKTSCSVFTFDCTVDGQVPVGLEDRVAFHPVCLGSKATKGMEGKTFMSLKEVMEMLGHDHITLLKMDIEGYEYEVFAEILRERDIHLPEQISFELHYGSHMRGLDWWQRQRTAGELALFSQRLYEAGYRVISREDNVLCVSCSEFTVVRFQCPTGGPSWGAA